MPSCDVYVNFKTSFKFETYLVSTTPILRRALCAFRLNNSRLPKVLGRYTNTPREQRYCTLCIHERLLGDEYHILLECKNPQVVYLRNRYIPTPYTSHPSMQKCIELLSSENVTETRKLAAFIRKVMQLNK